MAGRPSPQNPLISRLTSPPETIPSCYPGIRHTEFQPHSGRHQCYVQKAQPRAVGFVLRRAGDGRRSVLAGDSLLRKGRLLNVAAIPIPDDLRGRRLEHTLALDRKRVRSRRVGLAGSAAADRWSEWTKRSDRAPLMRCCVTRVTICVVAISVRG